jgi:serine/threonine protein kinase
LVAGDIARDNAEIFLTDLGMARQSGSGSDVLLVGTYAYMHPSLRGSLRDQPKTWFARTPGARPMAISNSASFPVGAVRIGPFIDLYALGVVLVQLVTGTVKFAGAPSEQ